MSPFSKETNMNFLLSRLETKMGGLHDIQW